MPPTVNGCEVPSVITKELLLLYFPRGVLGLQKVDPETHATTPVLLGADGTLTLDENGTYHLFSAPSPGIEARSAPGPLASVRSFHAHDGGAGTASGSASPSLVESALSKISLFQAVGELKPPDEMHYDPNDIEARERFDVWHRRRKSQMWHYFFINAFVLIMSMAALIVDLWLTCECASLGMWGVCADCVESEKEGRGITSAPTPVPMTLPVGTFAAAGHRNFDVEAITYSADNTTWVEVGSREYSKCVATDSFASCQNPSFQSLQVLLIIFVSGLGLNLIVVCIDLGLNFTPRRPFYAFVFIATWAIWLSIWAVFARAAVTPVLDNLTQVECAMQRSLQSAVSAQLTGSTIIYVTNNTRTAETTRYRATVTRCKFSWSFWLIVSAWALWTLIGGAYFYRRYMSWRRWGSTTSTLRTLVGLNGATSIVPPDHVGGGDGHFAGSPRQISVADIVREMSTDGGALAVLSSDNSASNFDAARQYSSMGSREASFSAGVAGGGPLRHHSVHQQHGRTISQESFHSNRRQSNGLQMPLGSALATTSSTRQRPGHHRRTTSIESAISFGLEVAHTAASGSNNSAAKQVGSFVDQMATGRAVSVRDVGIELVGHALGAVVAAAANAGGSASNSRMVTPSATPQRHADEADAFAAVSRYESCDSPCEFFDAQSEPDISPR